MGRTIIVDESVLDYIDQLSHTGQWYVGLIIGQLTTQKDYVVHLVRSPELAEDEAEEESDDDKNRTRKKSSTKPPSLEEADESWVATHAKQVTRMLPGGLDVIGLFAVAPPKMLQNAQMKLRQILFAVHKVLVRGQVLKQENSITERVIYQYCSATKKGTCKTIDVNDNKSSIRPAEWKYQSIGDLWVKLKSCLAVDVKMNVPTKMENQNLIKQLQSGLGPFIQQIEAGLSTVNGSMRDGLQLLDSSAEGKKGKGKRDASTVPQQTYNINIYTDMCDNNNVTEPQLKSCCAKLHLRGCIQGLAYVSRKATVSEAVWAMKHDLVRSLLSRCELLCEDIDVIDEDVAEELYNTPVRVFASFPRIPLSICDYMFHDERVDEVTDRLTELLDISVKEESLDLDSERVATEEDTQTPARTSDSMSAVLETVIKSENKAYSFIGGVIGIAMAILAAGITYSGWGDS